MKVVLWESNAILRYLAAGYAPRTLVARRSRQRARMADRWMDWQFDYAEAQRDAFLSLVRKPESERDPAAIERSVAAQRKQLAVLDRIWAKRRGCPATNSASATCRWASMPIPGSTFR